MERTKKGTSDDHITVKIYDFHSGSISIGINSDTQVKDIIHTIEKKIGVSKEDSKYFSLVLILTTFNFQKRSNIHVLRTLSERDIVLDVFSESINNLSKRFSSNDVLKIKSSAKWFFKDQRTHPIDLGDSIEIIGEFDSDNDEEEISDADLYYLSRSDTKGYLLKRSNNDFNVWKKYYCVLLDSLWCVDLNHEKNKVLKVKLSGMIRYKEGKTASDSNKVQNITINSMAKTYVFRAFSIQEHKMWVNELNIKISLTQDNDPFLMAEVIISDEEESRSNRLHKQVENIVNSNEFLGIFFEEETEENQNYQIKGSIAGSPLRPKSESHGYSSQSDSHVASNGLKKTKSDFAINHQNNLPVSLKTEASNFLRKYPNHSLCHYLHNKNPLLSNLIGFLVEVQLYKETFRHDLYIHPDVQRFISILLFTKYIVPQIKLSGLKFQLDIPEILYSYRLEVVTSPITFVRVKEKPEKIKFFSSSKNKLLIKHYNSIKEGDKFNFFQQDYNNFNKRLVDYSNIKKWGLDDDAYLRLYSDIFGANSDESEQLSIDPDSTENVVISDEVYFDKILSQYNAKRPENEPNMGQSSNISSGTNPATNSTPKVPATTVENDQKKNSLNIFWPWFSGNSNKADSSKLAKRSDSEDSLEAYFNGTRCGNNNFGVELFDPIVTAINEKFVHPSSE